MDSEYNGSLTLEQFLFYEMRIIAKLICQGFNREDILQKVIDENLFQLPTERKIRRFTNTCFKRIDALESEELVYDLANCSAEVGKQINLYAMMKYNRLVWDFMTSVIGEKYRTQEFEYSQKDLNVFFFRLQEQNDKVATWSELTVKKIKQVLNKCLVECEYLNTIRSTNLNLITIVPELEDAIRSANDLAALPAFNCFR